MRSEHGTVAAIERLVTADEIQSGLLRYHQLGIIKRSMEATVLQFPSRFTPATKLAAAVRLKGIEDPTAGARLVQNAPRAKTR